MIDIKLIRENPQEIEQKLKKKDSSVSLARILELDEKRRTLLTEVEELKHQRNTASKEIGELIAKKEDASQRKNEVKEVSEMIKNIDSEVRDVEAELQKELLQLPNIPHDSVPYSENADDKIIVKSWKDKAVFNFQPRNHVELGKGLNLFDFERAAKISQSQFAMYVGMGAQLEWALIRYLMDTLTREKGFTLVIPPQLVNETTAYTSGNLPKFREQLYKCADDELFLIPTSEVPMCSMHRDEIIPEEDLPLRYCAYTPCFRREAGTYGKEERGLIRVHQFNKVEMFVFCRPEESFEQLDRLIANAESLVEGLGLHYRTALLVTTDIAQQSAKTCDIEVWLPGQNSYYEVSSCSNCTDFQALRGNIRYRHSETKKPRHLHTLNGSGLATSRLMVSILETYQQEDGSVVIPEVLRPYLAGLDKLTPSSK